MALAESPPGRVEPPPPRRRRGRARLPLAVWLFLLIPAGVEAVWIFWPAASSFYLAMTRWDGLDAPEFVGLDNFVDLASDPIFLTALRHNVVWLVGFGIGSVLLGLVFALALNTRRKGVGVYRALIYLPMVFSLLVTALFWRGIYQPQGVLNLSLGRLGLESWQRQWLADPDVVLGAVLVAAVWRQVGYVMVLYLAGLQALDPALDDAGRIDGGSAWQRFWHITMPQLSPVNTIVAVVTMIDALRTFDVVWAMTGGGPFNSSELLSTYMFRVAFTDRQLGYASAVALVIFLITLVFIVIFLVRSVRDDR